jgi:hypothetical protein
MARLIGTGNNQVPTNGMLGGMAFQSPEDVQVDKIQENRVDVVSQTDIGIEPNQIPLNQMLGINAFTNIEYLQGTWTPVYNSTGVTFTHSLQIGTFVKVGSLVFISCLIAPSNISGTTTNQLFITGLPFTPRQVSSQNIFGCNISRVTSWSVAPIGAQVFPTNGTITNFIELYKFSGTNMVDSIASDLASNCTLRLNGFYEVGTST